jgi:2',3'-cyclic-nucleotide 2'-phosphodiesterase (5'-nucleotidase family)
MSKILKVTIIFAALLGAFVILPMMALQASSLPQSIAARPEASPLAPNATITFTILHTNDFHGRLEINSAESFPGMARTGKYISDTRAALGAANVVLLDAGDMMQGSLLSNMYYGQSTIDIYNKLGYNAATFGNHEFDWSQQVLVSRTQEAAFKFVVANLVVNDTGNCATAGWTLPVSFTMQPWMTMTVGTAPDQAVLGVIGVASVETPYITKVENTAGLCFKDPAESIIHYYDAVKAAGADVIVVLSHNGYDDGGYGYGIQVYGDKTLAQKLVVAGKPVSLIIGGHSHTDMTASSPNKPNGDLISGTLIVQANNSGLQVGQATITVTTGVTPTVSWLTNKFTTSSPADATIQGWIDAWKTPEYLAKVNQVIGYTAVNIVRDRYGDSLMADLVNDSLYGELNHDTNTTNDVDFVVNNSGGIRANINMVNPISNGTTNVFTITYGSMYDVLPFGNQLVYGTMTGAQIQELLNFSAAACASGCTTGRSFIQGSGITYTYYAYTDTLPGLQPWAWGAYNIKILSKATSTWEPLVLTKTYRLATNEFLAPAGQDGFLSFKYIQGLTYSNEDMLDIANRWISKTFTFTSPYSATLDGRITRNGGSTYTGAPTEIVPVTVLHHNDSHGNLLKGAFVGYSQLVTLINQGRAHNPTRNLLLSSGDNMQGDAMMYYFKSSYTGKGSDGTTLPDALKPHPLIAAFNAMNYTAYTLGNHEFNFGKDVFVNVLKQANFPVLQANLYDNGTYGLNQVPVKADVTSYLPGPAGTIKVAILGIGNHRVPNYELPSNIPGLTFTNPISETQVRAPALKAGHDAVIALTHIGFTTNPKSVEVDNNVDTNLAAQTTGVDAIIGGHSHTNPAAPEPPYKYLPSFVGNPNGAPVIINHAYRYNNTLGTVVLGLLPKTGGGYNVVVRAGRYQSVASGTAEDPTIKGIVDPYSTTLAVYNNTPAGYTAAPIDTTNAYVAETNAANLQADASVAELKSHGINPDFHLSGAMTRPSSQSNWVMFKTATPTTPTQMLVSDMFTLMPYENSLVALRMNGPQLKTVLERAYRNYFYYKYVPGQGGYSYYTTCMLDTNTGNQIQYRDTYPLYPNGNNVAALLINGQPVNFLDATKYYTVSTVNYLAAGSCNFNNNGVSLWPLDPASIVADTQYYVRDAVINYTTAQGTVTPTIEGRLQFAAFSKIVFLPTVLK